MYVSSTIWFLPTALILAAVLLTVVLCWVPIWQVNRVRELNRTERFDRENEARKTLATILGGMLLLVGFFGTWQNLKVAQESASTSQKALLVSQEGQITDRFTKAIDQLGAVGPNGKPKLEVRLGGIYALERISNDSKKDHWAIVEILSTYVRENAPVNMQDVLKNNELPSKLKPRIDIQAALTVLGRRDRSDEADTRRIDLNQADLSTATLGHANFSGTSFVNADLRGAILEYADFSRSILWGANLSGAILQSADFRQSSLQQAVLVNTKLDLPGFPNAGVDLRAANFAGANLSRAYFGRAKLDGANFIYADLTGANISGADLSLVQNLTQEQIEKAFGDTNTKLPSNLHRPKGWGEAGVPVIAR